MSILERSFAGNTLSLWLIALVLAFAVAVAARLLLRALVHRLAVLAERTETYWDDVLVGALGATKSLFFVVLGALVMTVVLDLPRDLEQVVRKAAAVSWVVQGGFWLTSAIASWLQHYRRTRLQNDAAAATTVSALGFLSKLVLWSLVLLLALDNLGVDVTALIAGLGVGGIAVALAAQNILGDLFASLSIVLDKPFALGDFIVIGEFMGTIENIGLKTTRVRSLTGEQLVFSNADLLGSRIRNFGRMKERRILFTLGVTYQTPRDKLARIPVLLREIVTRQDKVRFDRAHFRAFGPSSLDFEIVYFVQVPDFVTAADIQQAINLAIVEAFAAEGIDFAYPTQTVYVAKSD